MSTGTERDVAAHERFWQDWPRKSDAEQARDLALWQAEVSPFAGRARFFLLRAGYVTRESITQADDATLLGVYGIGPQLLAGLRHAFPAEPAAPRAVLPAIREGVLALVVLALLPPGEALLIERATLAECSTRYDLVWRDDEQGRGLWVTAQPRATNG